MITTNSTHVGNASQAAESLLPNGSLNSLIKPNATERATTTPANVIRAQLKVFPNAGRCKPTESQPRFSFLLMMNNTKAAKANKMISRSKTFRVVRGTRKAVNNPLTNGIEKRASASPTMVQRRIGGAIIFFTHCGLCLLCSPHCNDKVIQTSARVIDGCH